MKATSRIKPEIVVNTPSPNFSERSASIKAIVLHATEGHNFPNSPQDLENLGSWFANPNSQVSSHIATDGDGNSARFVKDNKKAWHVYLFNSLTLGIEQVGYTAQSNWPEPQLQETARWIAHYSMKFNIPIQIAEPSGTSSGQTPSFTQGGVTTHKLLGHNGGDHGDPGTGFPLTEVIDLAKQYKVLLQKEK